MKIFLFDSSPADGPRLIADCGVLRDVRPFFIPNTSASWRYDAAVAWQVGRLGKNIGERFASRYIEGAYACVVTAPQPDAPGDYGRCHEGAVIIGTMLPDPTAPFTMETAEISVTVTPDFAEACRLIADASRYCQLKNGDLIITSVTPLALDLPINSVITAPGLNARLK